VARALPPGLRSCALKCSLPTTVKTTPVPPPRSSPSGAVLICDEAATTSLLAQGCSCGLAETDIYAGLAAVILERSRLDVIFHLRCQLAKATAIREAIERNSRLSPNERARLRVIEAVPLETALPCVDLLVSFASPALIQGCRNGLKPIQIGQAVTDSGAFSHIFFDIDSFADALATGGLTGRLSVREYEQFEEFRRRLSGRTLATVHYTIEHGPRAAWRRARDPVIRECCRSEWTWSSRIRAIASAIANPVVVWRLLRGSFRRPEA
jgi:hypothetical protein